MVVVEERAVDYSYSSNNERPVTMLSQPIMSHVEKLVCHHSKFDVFHNNLR